MNREIHMFDLDGTLWNIDSEIWIIDKDKPYKPVIKISHLEFSLIRNGVYRKDNIPLDYNGNKFFISKRIWNKIYKKKRSENINRYGISFKNYGTKKDINNSDITFLLDNIYHLKGKNTEVGILTARPNLKIHSDVVNELRLKLKDMGITLDKIYFSGDKFKYYHDDKSSLKKVYILLEHLIGFKIKDGRFTPSRQDWYTDVHFYDDAKINIDYSNDIQKILDTILKKTDDELFEIINNRINENNIKLHNHLISSNEVNRFDTDIIELKEPNKYPIREKLLTNFDNFVSLIKK